jgi:DNA-binding Lrp family transcriptional regulator
LFKQARKYGVCCLMATQNPADVDYKAMAQFGTWAIGRLTTRQDMKKVQPTVKSLDPVHVDAIMEELPSQKPGQFVLISPDNFKQTHRLQCRWLFTQHETLDDERIEELMDRPWQSSDPHSESEAETVRERFTELEHTLGEEETLQQLEDLPEPEAEDEEEELPPDEPVVGPSSTATLQVDPEIDETDKQLAKAASMSTKEFAAKAGIGEAAARGRLMRLLAAKRAKKFKVGRENRYYSLSSGLRPDLGLDRKVQVIVSRVSSNDAERAAREVRRSASLFGMIGDDEELDHVEIDHRLVIQLSFTEKVTRMFLKRLFGPRHDEMLDNIYLHPENLKIVIFDPGTGIRLEERPEEYASRIVDFDGAVTFEEKRPADVKLHEAELRNRKTDDVIKESFRRRFKATPKKVQLVFLPVWNLHLKSRSRAGKRIVVVDALVGKPLEW